MAFRVLEHYNFHKYFLHFQFSCLHFDDILAASIAEHASALGIEPNEYRIICRNGTLADRTGFDVEQECALTTIVDGEIVVARNNRKTTGIINALSSYDKYFQSDPDFKMYNSFAGERDLLFKVSGQIFYDRCIFCSDEDEQENFKKRMKLNSLHHIEYSLPASITLFIKQRIAKKYAS